MVERKHQNLLNVARALLFHAHMPVKFQGHAILIATHLINKIHVAKYNNLTPIELLFHKPPSYDHLKSFGCLCFASNIISHRMKLDSKARRCVPIGYPVGVKGYQLYDLDSKTCLIFRDVIFHKGIFSFLKIQVELQIALMFQILYCLFFQVQSFQISCMTLSLRLRLLVLFLFLNLQNNLQTHPQMQL